MSTKNELSDFTLEFFSDKSKTDKTRVTVALLETGPQHHNDWFVQTNIAMTELATEGLVQFNPDTKQVSVGNSTCRLVLGKTMKDLRETNVDKIMYCWAVNRFLKQ